MVKSLPKFLVPLLVMATGGMALPAAAQPAGQDIIFSSPATDAAQSATPSLTPQKSQLPTLPDSLQAPWSPLDFQPPRDDRPPPPANSAQQQRLKQQQAERRNWTLMTPAEIFGVTTPEKLLQQGERDAYGREKTPTQLERYLDRENQPRTTLTNGWRSDRANSPWSYSRDEDTANLFARGRNGAADPAQNPNRFPDGQQNPNAGANPNAIYDVNLPDPALQKQATKERLEQMASMERFRQMLQPSPSPAPGSRFSPTAKTVVNPNLTPPEVVPNAAGATFTSLSSTIGRPEGLPPLPGIATPRQQPVVIPSWKPKPPPWLSQSPTAFPQQKF